MYSYLLGRPTFSSLLPDDVFINGFAFCSAPDILHFLNRETEDEWLSRIRSIDCSKQRKLIWLAPPKDFRRVFQDFESVFTRESNKNF